MKVPMVLKVHPFVREQVLEIKVQIGADTNSEVVRRALRFYQHVLRWKDNAPGGVFISFGADGAGDAVRFDIGGLL